MSIIVFLDEGPASKKIGELAQKVPDVKVCRQGQRKYPKETTFPGLYDSKMRQFHSNVEDIITILNMHLSTVAAQPGRGAGGAESEEYVGPAPMNMAQHLPMMPVPFDGTDAAPEYGDRMPSVSTRGGAGPAGGDALEKLMQARDKDLKQVRF